MSPEIDLVTLSGEEWDRIREAARELDLIRGGYFRVRPDAILFYCGPDNAPAGWSGPFPDGSPELPRAALGEAEVLDREGGTTYTIRLIVSDWAAARRVKDASDRGDYRDRYGQFVRDQESALRGRDEDRQWLRSQFELLRRHARGHLIDE